MPITDASVLFEFEKTAPAKAVNVMTLAAPPNIISARQNQMDLYVLNSGSGGGSSIALSDNVLFKHQGQKWQQFYDFERMLKQIRICERQYVRGKPDSATLQSGSTNGKSLAASTKNAISPQTKADTSTAATTAATLGRAGMRPIKQVQRLNGNDMHYYGIVPKQAAIDVIVCSICMGIYTKVGFHNHMSLHHPSFWIALSSKIATGKTPSGDVIHSLQATDNSHDGVRDMGATSEILGSPSDVSGTMSTCSNASSSSSSSYATALSVRHNKSSQNGSIIGSGSSSTSGSGSRSRSKSKHHSSSSTSSSSADLAHTSSKSLKKHATPCGVANGVALSSAKEALPMSHEKAKSDAITSYATSSSSVSTTASRSIGFSNASDAGSLSGAQVADQAGYASLGLPVLSDNKESARSESPALLVTSKKTHSPKAPGKESSLDNSTTSSSEYKNGGFKASTAAMAYDKKHDTNSSLAADAASAYDAQISELNQAVSSITNCVENRQIGDRALVAAKSPAGSAENSSASPKTAASVSGGQSAAQSGHSETTTQSASDDNSILTLEDMLDPKFINEILNTAESDIQFDENELDTTTPQRAYLQQQQQQQPATKRMRYDPDAHVVEPLPNVPADYTTFEQQQQAYARYDVPTGVDEVKMYGTDQQLPLEATQQYQSQLTKLIHQQQGQQQHDEQITTIDPIQLQQLLYQQQNISAFGGGGNGLAQRQQQQQFGASNQLIDLCGEDGTAKSANGSRERKLREFTCLTSAVLNAETYNQQPGDNALSEHFQVFNVPSLTDDCSDDDDTDGITESKMERSAQSYTLPSNEEQQHLIYEITANNQVAVLSQQRQEQMLAEFLTQTNYDAIANPNAPEAAPTKSAAYATAASDGNELWAEQDCMLDFDFGHIETAKTLLMADGRSVKTEAGSVNGNGAACKFHDDYYLNVFIYAGVPKPLAINSFGLVKLPQAVATTFRKSLFTARKANNSPITLNSCTNSGLGGGGNGVAVQRLCSLSAKPAPNFFTALPNAAAGTDFSIGSITVSNATHLSQQQQQASSSAGAAGGDMPLLSAGNSAGGSKGRSRNAPGQSQSGGADMSNAGGSTAKSKPTAGASPPVAVVTPTARFVAPPATQSSKTIHISSAAAANERVRCVKRSLISHAAVTSAQRQPPLLLAKQIADILSESKPQQQQQPMPALATLPESETNRTKYFYEHRKKLFSLPSGRHQRQRRQSPFHQQMLRTTLTDCGINSSMKSKCTNSANSSSNSDDAMHVFV